MNPIGIMQGRLSPPSFGKIQSFPVQTWREEFFLAREAGLDCIEWVYEKETELSNPLRTDEGVREINRLAEGSGVRVSSVCADFYMKQQISIPHLQWLIGRAGLLGVCHIVLPFVDESSLQTSDELGALVRVLEAVLRDAERANVEIHLETDLEPREFVSLFKRISHPFIRVNYDIGNSAALGRDPEEELTLLGPWLGSVHVKDRRLKGNTVPLGTGAADFNTCFRLILQGGFHGSFILQAAREEGLSEVDLAIRNRLFVKEQLVLAIKPLTKPRHSDVSEKWT